MKTKLITTLLVAIILFCTFRLLQDKPKYNVEGMTFNKAYDGKVLALPYDLNQYNCSVYKRVVSKGNFYVCVLKEKRSDTIGQAKVMGEYLPKLKTIILDNNDRKDIILHELGHHLIACVRDEKFQEESCVQELQKFSLELNLIK